MEYTSFNARSYETVLSGDWHIGNGNTDKVALKEMIKYIKKSGANWLFTGDLLEATLHSHKNYDHRGGDPEIRGIEAEYEYARDIIKPIAKQCIGMITGNHDDRCAKHSEIDLIKQICNEYGITYLKDAAMTKLNYTISKKECGINIYSTHGFFSGRQIGGKVNALVGISGGIIADLYACGHSHEMFVMSKKRIGMTRFGNKEEQNVFFGNTGSFMRSLSEGKSSYAEKAGYAPNKIGYLKAIFDPTTRTVKMEEVIM